MIKKIIAASLSVALLIAAAVIFFPRKDDDGPVIPAEEGLTVGAAELSGSVSPFFPPSEGDLTVRSMVLSYMLCEEGDTQKTASPDVPSVAESRDIFFADGNFERAPEFSDGGFTAVSFVVKDGITFSDGTPVTKDDVLFSLYTYLDPLCECDKSAFFSLYGYGDYAHGTKGYSEAVATAEKILRCDVGETPSEGDGYTASDAADMRAYLTEYGAEYASKIKAYVLEKYCTDEMISSYVFEGITPDEVRNSEALSNAYAIRMWNFGSFTYDHTEDPDGAYVGAVDALGNIVYKTTYEAAMENEAYADYVRDDEAGTYRYDFAGGTYVPVTEEDDSPIRYRRVLSDKYIRMSRTALSGFRDTEGVFYTLQGDSFPTMSVFFDLMRNSYISDGTFDYRSLEKMESADSYSFSEKAVAAYAESHAEGGAVTSIEGIRTEKNDSGKDVVTLYFEGNDYVAADGANFAVVSASSCMKGFDASSCTLSKGGSPVSSEAFFEHLGKIKSSAVSAGPYVCNVYDGEGRRAYLVSNHSFDVFGKGDPATERITVKDTTGKSISSMLSSGEIMISAAPVTKEDIASASGATEVVYYPNNAYKYVLINPAVYKSIDARRAIASTIDASMLYGDGTKPIYGFVPTFFDSYEKCGAVPYDASASSCAAYFDSAGYRRTDDGVLIDPATKEKAFFKFYLLPEEEGGAAEQMLNKSLEILRYLGADGEIVFDADLKTRVYSDENVPIYVLGWEVGEDLSMYERYAYSSASSAVKGCGLEKLYTVGQIDSVGKISYVDADGLDRYTTQSDAVEELDRAIRLASASINRNERKSLYVTAQHVVSDLVFEIPLCEYNGAYMVRRDLVDVDTLYKSPTSLRGPLSEVWSVRLTGQDEE